MAYLFKLNQQAYQEYIKAYEWYELKQKGLGAKFMYAIEKRLNQILQHPEYYSKQYKNYREVKVENFPYMIVYEIFNLKQIIHIAAIHHSKRNPKQKYRMLK